MLSSSVSRTTAIGNDGSNVYNYNYRIVAASDLLVTVRNTITNIETTLVLTTDFTVQGIGQVIGTITLVNSGQAWLDQSSGDLNSSYMIVIRRTRPRQQNTSIRNQGAYYASVHENEFDDLVMQIQDLWDYINRAVTLPETAQPSDFNPILPAANGVIGAVPGSVLQVNPAGNGWAFADARLGWLSVDIPYSLFSAAATSQQVNAFTLPPNCILMGVAIKHRAAFTGASITDVTMDLGTAGVPDLFLSAFDVFQSVSDSAFANATVQNIQSFVNPTNIVVRANSSGANLSALSQGCVRVFYWYMNL